MKSFLQLLVMSSFLFCCSNTPIMSQDSDSWHLRFGVKGGLNLSNLNTDNTTSSNIILGYNIGVFAKFPLTEFLSIQPEVQISSKGAEVSYNDLFVNGTAKFNTTYLEFPFLFVVNITNFANVHFGPYAALLMNASVTNQSNVSLFNFEENLSTEDFNRLDIGFSAGLGLDLDAISIGARYNFGFLKVGKERDFLGHKYTFPDARNGVTNFYVSISLN